MNHIRSMLAAAGFALMGSASAAGNDTFVPVAATANAPGSVRTDTCSRPAYPEQDLRQNHQGTVTIRLLLDTGGTVKRSLVATSSGHPTLDQAALTALSACRFYPPLVDGNPVEAWTAIQYTWKP